MFCEAGCDAGLFVFRLPSSCSERSEGAGSRVIPRCRNFSSVRPDRRSRRLRGGIDSKNMLSDLDRLLRERDLDALIVPMHEALYPSFRWITRGAKVTRGYAVKLAGR